MKREVIAELLDDDLGTPEEIADSLADLRHINNWFGGTSTTTRLLRRVARDRPTELSLLEIGAGLGDVPLEARRALARDGIDLRVTLLDRLGSHLPTNGTPVGRRHPVAVLRRRIRRRELLAVRPPFRT